LTYCTLLAAMSLHRSVLEQAEVLSAAWAV
jgi:hypothetical protein